MEQGEWQTGLRLPRIGRPVFVPSRGQLLHWGVTRRIYRVPHVRMRGQVVYTNNIYACAFRGYGNPQATFALESQIDRMLLAKRRFWRAMRGRVDLEIHTGLDGVVVDLDHFAQRWCILLHGGGLLSSGHWLCRNSN